eukprot:SAG31_NODE_4236_length_3427_cov_24.184574_2_plen_127_part_00
MGLRTTAPSAVSPIPSIFLPPPRRAPASHPARHLPTFTTFPRGTQVRLRPVILHYPLAPTFLHFSPHGVSTGLDLGGLDEPEGTCETTGGVLRYSRLVVEGMDSGAGSSTESDRCVLSLPLLARSS